MASGDMKFMLEINLDLILLAKSQARVDAVKARVAGLQAANAQRAVSGDSPAYDERHFFQAESELNELADEMDRLARDIRTQDTDEAKPKPPIREPREQFLGDVS